MTISTSLLLSLRSLVANGAETHTLLYFIDHILQLTPKTNIQQSLIQQMQRQNAELQRKIKEALKQIKQTDENLKLVQTELKIRSLKNEKLEQEIKKMRYAEARRVRKETKKQEKERKRESESAGSILAQLENEHKKSEADTTQEGETIQNMMESTQCVGRTETKSTLKCGTQDEQNWRECSNSQLQQCEVCGGQWCAIVRAVDYSAVNKVQPKI